MSQHNDNDLQHPDISRIVHKVSDHVETRIEYVRLILLEKLSIAFVKMASTGIIFALFLLFFFFLNVAAAFWIGRHYNNNAIGFGMMALFYLTAALIYLLFRKPVFEKKMLDSVIASLFAEQENSDDDEDEA